VKPGSKLARSFIIRSKANSSRRANIILSVPRGSAQLERFLNDHAKLKDGVRQNWDKNCAKGITSTATIQLTRDLLSYFETFDFSIFSSKSVLELITGHATTPYHAVRFGGGLPMRPSAAPPPAAPHAYESRYVRQLLDA
jgi:hypothetical protein